MKWMKKWFYYGIVVRRKMSVRKIAGAGQKVPPDWESKMFKMHERICMKQKSEKCDNG